jgi:hypothetical protein
MTAGGSNVSGAAATVAKRQEKHPGRSRYLGPVTETPQVSAIANTYSHDSVFTRHFDPGPDSQPASELPEGIVSVHPDRGSRRPVQPGPGERVQRAGGDHFRVQREQSDTVGAAARLVGIDQEFSHACGGIRRRSERAQHIIGKSKSQASIHVHDKLS